jgi:PTH1 family peptidyl-tRNA hydrolase
MKPTTYMNRSGLAVADAVRFYKIDLGTDLLVIVDDLYLPVGAVRLRPGGGTGGHNGLADIQRTLGSDVYPRLRIGVGVQPDGGKPPMINQADFVLSRFLDDELPDLNASLDRAALAAESFITRGLAPAMNLHNTKDN